MRLYAAYFEGFGVQDPEPMEHLPQTKVPRMSDAEYLAAVKRWGERAKARKDKEKTR